MKNIILKKYYFITDHLLSKNGIFSDVEDALSAGVGAIQYRCKTEYKDVMISQARVIKKLCSGTMVSFIVNDDLEVARAVDADGFHIGQGDVDCISARQALGCDKIIGVSVSTVEEAILAKEQGADYLGVGPIFLTSTKKDAKKPCGINLIREIKKIISIPLIAIGGITLDNVKEVVEAGADGMCAISAVVGSKSVAEEIRKFNEFFRKSS